MSDENPFEGGLMDIDPPRPVTARPKTKLENLLEKSEAFVQLYADTAARGGNDLNERLNGLRDGLLEQLMRYDEADFGEFIRVRRGHEYPDIKARALGMFTGQLACAITTLNAWAEKETHLIIDGEWETFPYLLANAKFLDRVTIRNVRGDGILLGVAERRGYANELYVENVQGDHIAANAACNGGEIRGLVFYQVQGNNIGAFSGHMAGKIGWIIGDRVQGTGLLAASGGGHGKIGGIMVRKSDGLDMLGNALYSSGRAELIILEDNEGNEPNFLSAYGPTVGRMAVFQVDWSADIPHKRKICMTIQGDTGRGPVLEEVREGAEAQEEYNHLRRQLHLDAKHPRELLAHLNTISEEQLKEIIEQGKWLGEYGRHV